MVVLGLSCLTEQVGPGTQVTGKTYHDFKEPYLFA
jgi:hypothetical protein